ncbi:amidohydrolase family protein [Blautia sp. HCP3S3_H10_1]|uniref:amidohydrolase family protein n=1 Tax=unclassified Blautia TaxID=2648079 RepID=UPI003F8E399D
MRKMFGECHAHVIMDGLNYKEAISIHKEHINDDAIRRHLKAYQKFGITFVRDGGDALGVSARAKELALEYGIDYRTPVFAIHKNGHYGSIVGKGFEDMKEYDTLVKEAKSQGADFIKIMTTGLLDFNDHGQITGTPLERNEVREMVHIAHEEGMAVMSHTNGVYGVQAAVEAGVDSVEHGNFIDEETIRMLADSDTVWVPTLVTVRNLQGCGRYEESVLDPIVEQAAKNVRLAYRYKVKMALGSDAGAYRVFHGKGLAEEYQAFRDILGEEVDSWLEDGEKKIQATFRRPES